MSNTAKRSSNADLNIGLASDQLKGIAQILNDILSNEYILYTKTRNYHWNVVGSNFSELHKFFEEQYGQLDEMIDEIAERVRSVGGLSFGTLQEFLKAASLKENPGEQPMANQMIANLLADHEELIRSMRVNIEKCEEFGDAGTADFITGMMEAHEKMAWMLRSYLVVGK